jgi:flagellar assembly protein FliH
LLPVIREALSVFIEEERVTHVKLNPEDLALLGEALHAEFKQLPLALEADPLITRGGCVLESAGRVVNGQIEKRWARVIDQLGLHMPWEPSDASE